MACTETLTDIEQIGIDIKKSTKPVRQIDPDTFNKIKLIITAG